MPKIHKPAGANAPQTNTARVRVKKALLATTITAILAGVAFTVWIMNTQAEKLIMQAANVALAGMDSELIDIELGNNQLEDWRIASANLRVNDSHIRLNNLNIKLKLDWPQSFAELKQYAQVSYLTQKITHISTGEIEVELGQSLFVANQSAIDKQGPAVALDIKSLPLIDIGKTSLILKAQSLNTQSLNTQSLNARSLNAKDDLPAYRLVMDKLSLNGAGEISSEFSHAGESIAKLKATLETNKWQLKSQIQLAPLLASIHQISLRQTQDSVLRPLAEFDTKWQALAIDLQGQLVSNSSVTLTSGEVLSEHQLIAPKLTFNQLAALELAPKPALEFQIAGHLTELDLKLEPFSLALSPNTAQQQRLMQLLDETLAKPLTQSLAQPSSQSLTQPAAKPASEQVPDQTASQIAKLLSGLKSTDAPVGIALTLPEAWHYPLTHIQQDAQSQPLKDEPLENKPLNVKLPQLQLKTLGSKLDTQVDLANIEITTSTEALAFNMDWRLNAKQTSPLQLSELWANTPHDLSWNTSQLTTAGKLRFNRAPSATDWQFTTAPIEAAKTTQAAKHNAGDTLHFAIGGLKYINPQEKNTAKYADIRLGSIRVHAHAPLKLDSQQILNISPVPHSEPASDTKLTLALPPLTLALEQLHVSQTTQTLVTETAAAKTLATEANTDKSTDKNTDSNSKNANNIISKTDMGASHFSIALQQAMSFELKPNNEAPLDSLLSSPWLNQLEWRASQLNIEKQLSSKGRSRKETVLKLDTLTLAQALNWKNNTLLGDEHWQVGTVELQSQHKLNLANANEPLLLTGQWVVDTSMTEALSLLNQTQPLPAELNVTGHNQLQAQFKLTQKRNQTQFAMQITQSMTELEGFYKDTTFEGGKLQAQCEFTWGQSYKKEPHKKEPHKKGPPDKDSVNSLSKLNCPQTRMTFNLFDPGFPLTDIEVEADIALGKDAQKLPDNWLQQLTGLSDIDVSMTAKGKVLSGQFLLPDFNLKLQDKSHAYLLLQGMSLEEVLRIQPQIGVYADGIFDGVLPVDLVNGKVSITGGQLAARAPGGLIAISGNPAVDQMRQSQPYLDFVFSALEHLQYSQLSSSFDMDTAGDAKLLVEVKGQSQGIERPIHLNYSHEENMLQLFRSLQIGNDLQDRIEKSVK